MNEKKNHMVEVELVDPTLGFLIGIDLLDGVTNDISEDGSETEITILSLGFLFFKINFLWIK